MSWFTCWWGNFLCDNRVRHRTSTTDKRASVGAAASRSSGPHCQHFMHFFFPSDIFLVGAHKTSVATHARAKHTMAVSTNTYTNWLLQAWQRLRSSGDTGEAYCLFVSSSALFPLERYITAGRGAERKKWTGRLLTPCSYIYSVTSPLSSNFANGCFHNLCKWQVQAIPRMHWSATNDLVLHSRMFHEQGECEIGAFTLTTAHLLVTHWSCRALAWRISDCSHTKLVTHMTGAPRQWPGSMMYTHRGSCSASVCYIRAWMYLTGN